MIDHLLFLDIDGVLTSDQSGTSYHCENPDTYHPDAQCKANLLKVAAAVPGLKVVLHSAWTMRINDDVPSFEYRGKTYYSPLNNVVNWLIEYDLFHGLTTPERYHEGTTRRFTKKEKILEWIAAHRQELSSNCRILVIDDDTAFNDLVTINLMKLPGIAEINFLAIDFHTGFTENDAAEAIKYFTK